MKVIRIHMGWKLNYLKTQTDWQNYSMHIFKLAIILQDRRFLKSIFAKNIIKYTQESQFGFHRSLRFAQRKFWNKWLITILVWGCKSVLFRPIRSILAGEISVVWVLSPGHKNIRPIDWAEPIRNTQKLTKLLKPFQKGWNEKLPPKRRKNNLSESKFIV